MKRLRLALAALLFATPLFAQTTGPQYPSAPFYPAQSYTAVAPATPAATAVKASSAYLLHVSCFNALSTPVYIKLFNAAAASVALGTTNATMNLMCPGNTTGAGFVQNFTWPPGFGTALVYAVTGGIALNDDTSITASSVIVNITYY